MKLDSLRFRFGLAALMGALLTQGAPAMAQPASDASGPPTPTAESLTVVAPRVVRHEVTGGTARFSGSPIEVLSVTHPVSFADLDLTTQAGVDQFRQRIMYASLDACDRIDAEYPPNIYVPVSANQNCPDATARAALQVADQIIAASRRR